MADLGQEMLVLWGQVLHPKCPAELLQDGGDSSISIQFEFVIILKANDALHNSITCHFPV